MCRLVTLITFIHFQICYREWDVKQTVILICVALAGLAFYATLQIISGEWTLDTAESQSPAPIIKGPNYNEVGSTESQRDDPWVGTVSIQPAFLEDRRFRDCGPRCVEEVDAAGNPLQYSAERESMNPTCSVPIYSPETFDMAFAENEVRAEAIYRTGCWRLTGRIANIETSFLGGARFQLHGPTGASIQCHVPEAFMNKLMNVNRGDRVVVKGIRPSRVLGGVVFGECNL